MAYTALIAGASGLVGGNCLQLLLDDKECTKVISIGRRVLDIKHAKLQQETIDFEKLADHANLFDVDQVYCCLGTTIKTAGSKENFRKVDFDFPLNIAEVAEGSAKVFSIITAQGSDAKSPIFYNKVKGQLEDALQALQIDKINIIQPALLLGSRDESRPGETIAQGLFKLINPLFRGSMKKYKGIPVEQVAKAMVTLAKEGKTGYHKYSSDQLWEY
ncbi:MAG: oxidoreductase [Chitinophagales bacterium]